MLQDQSTDTKYSEFYKLYYTIQNGLIYYSNEIFDTIQNPEVFQVDESAFTLEEEPEFEAEMVLLFGEDMALNAYPITSFKNI